MKPDFNPLNAHSNAQREVALGDVIQSAFRVVSGVAVTDTGVVYEARDLLLERDVAVKLAWRDQAPGQLLAEARRCGSVNDPASVLIHGIGTHRELEFAIAERLHGRPFRELLGSAALSPSIYLKRLRQIISGVAAAHDAGLAAGDLTSQTMWQCNDGRLVLGRISLSQVPSIGPLGSNLTPEIAIGLVAPEDPSAAELGDLYHVGCVAIELARGAPPFEGDLASLTRAHAYDQAPRLADLRMDLPSELSDLVAWLLEKQASARPRSAGDVLLQLDTIIERQTPARRTLRVLVIDDDTTRARWIANIARRANSHVMVEIAFEGTDAAHKLNRDQPDLAIVDAGLHGVMNALELCMYARSLESTVRTQLVLLGEVEQRDQAVLDRSNVTYIDDDQQTADALLDLVRRAAATIAMSPRSKRTTISG
jgi:serine/threonine protein kinase